MNVPILIGAIIASTLAVFFGYKALIGTGEKFSDEEQR